MDKPMENNIKIVTLCGSMRYLKQMMEIAGKLELEKGYSVIQCVYNVDGNKYDEKDMEMLGKLHKRKIDVSDAIYVVNIDGYIGNSTKSEIEYALKHGKEVIYHENI